MGPKKGKKSKGETEEQKVAREELERLAKIAEEKRVAAEKERQRLEELRIQAERKLFREEEIARLAVEYAALQEQNAEKVQQKAFENEKEKARVEWLRYKDPTDETDAAVEKDMHTFIMMSKAPSSAEMKDTLELIKSMEIVTRSVENVWTDSLARGDQTTQKRCMENMQELQSVMTEKIDAATVRLLRFADSMLNDRLELSLEEEAGRFSIGIWSSYNDIRPIRKSIQLEKMGIQLDIPKQLLSQNEKFIYRLIRIPVSTYNYEAYNTTAAGLDSEAFRTKGTKYVLGGLIQFNILMSAPPPFHLRAKRWVMRDCSTATTSLRTSHYPSSVPSRMLLKVPQNIVMSDAVRVGVWDEVAGDWTEDGISDLQYIEETRTLQFYITTVGTLALVKSRVADFPYKKWSLGPMLDASLGDQLLLAGPDVLKVDPALYTVPGSSIYPPLHEKQARMTVKTQKNEVVIDVVNTMCRLVQPDTIAFADMKNKLFTPAVILSELRRRGINLLPTSADTLIREGAAPKTEAVERAAVAEISRSVASLDFQSCSEWNATLGESQVGIQARESTVYTCPFEHFDFECVLAEEDKVCASYTNYNVLGLLPGAPEEQVKYSLVFGNEYGDRNKRKAARDIAKEAAAAAKEEAEDLSRKEAAAAAVIAAATEDGGGATVPAAAAAATSTEPPPSSEAELKADEALFSHDTRPAEISHLTIDRAMQSRLTPEAVERCRDTNARFQETVATLLSLMRAFSMI